MYLDEKEKLHNSELSDYNNLINFEDNIKNTFGFKFKKKDIESIDLLINKSINNFNIRNLEIDNFVNKNFYNLTDTSNFFKNNMDKVFD